MVLFMIPSLETSAAYAAGIPWVIATPRKHGEPQISAILIADESDTHAGVRAYRTKVCVRN